jgi:hypothetical protein
MRSSRFLAVLTAAMLLVVYSGCGGEEKKDTSSTGSGGATQPKAGEKGAASSTGRPAASADKVPIEVSIAAPDHYAAIVINPRRLAASPLVAEQLKTEKVAEAIKTFGIDPSEVEQIVVLLSMRKTQRGLPEPVAVITARFTHDVDARQVAAKLEAAGALGHDAPGPKGPEPAKEVQVGGKTCFTAAPGWLACTLGKNTIVLAPGENMEKTLALSASKGPLYERLKAVDTDNDLIVVAEIEQIPDLDKQIDALGKGAPQTVKNYLDAVKTLRGVTLGLNLTGDSLLQIVLEAKDVPAAENVQGLLKDGVTLLGALLAGAEQSASKETKAKFADAFKLGDEAIAGLTVTPSDTRVTVTMKRPATLDKIGALAEKEDIQAGIMQAMGGGQAGPVPGSRARQMNNMKQITLAMLVYESHMRNFPPAVIEKDGKPLLSWRVAILPYLEQDALYKQFHLDEPWDSPSNLEAAKKMPAVFQSPDSPSDGKTRVMLFTGKDAAFDGGKKIRSMDIRDGTANTILCVEAGPDKAVPWTKPADLPFDPEKPLAALGNVSPQGFLAAFFDGHVMQLKVDNSTLKALITPSGNEPINPAKLQGGR